MSETIGKKIGNAYRDMQFEKQPNSNLGGTEKEMMVRTAEDIVDSVIPQNIADVLLLAVPGAIGKRKAIKEGIKKFGTSTMNTAEKLANTKGIVSATNIKKLREGKTFTNDEFIQGQFDTGSEFNVLEALDEGRNYLINWMRAERGSKNTIQDFFLKRSKKQIKEVDEGIESIKYYLKDLKDKEGRTVLGRSNVYTKDQKAQLLKEGKNPGNFVEFNDTYFYDPKIQKALAAVNYNTVRENVARTAVHEYFHAFHANDDIYLGLMNTGTIKNAISDSIKELGPKVLPGSRYYSVKQKAYNTMDKKLYDYLSSPTEVYARIFELRYLLKETPKNLSKGYVRLDKSLNKSDAYRELRRVLSHKNIEQLYNNLPAMLPVGGYAAMQKDIDSRVNTIDSLNKKK